MNPRIKISSRENTLPVMYVSTRCMAYISEIEEFSMFLMTLTIPPISFKDDPTTNTFGFMIDSFFLG